MLVDIEQANNTPMASFATLHSALAYAGISAVLLIPDGSESLETLLDIHNASDWVHKPAKPEAIVEKIQAVLRRRHL